MKISQVCIRAVLFDLFGTLVKGYTSFTYQKMVHQMAEALGVPDHSFYTIWRSTFVQRVVGKYPSIRDHLIELCTQLCVTVPANSLDQAIQIREKSMLNALQPRNGAEKVLKSLRDYGYRVGVVTDCSPPIPTVWRSHILAQLIDVAIFSCEHGTKKPDPYMYTLACSGLNVIPSECIYVGDGGSKELTGALSAGLHPIKLDVPTFRYESDSFQGTRVRTLEELVPLLR